jgi:hypothetical protein
VRFFLADGSELSTADLPDMRATLPWMRRMARRYHCSLSTIVHRCMALTIQAWEAAGRPPFEEWLDQFPPVSR